MLKKDIEVILKYGENFKLTKENAKDIYFMTICNVECHEDLHKFLIENYTLDEIIGWNSEYIYSCIKEINMDIESERYETVCWVLENRKRILRTYVNDYNVLKDIVDMVKLIGNTYGYFYEYYWKIKDDSYDDPYFANEYIVPFRNRDMSTGKHDFFSKNDQYIGFLPTLKELGYMDLYNDMVENVVKPTIDAFMVETEFMKKLNIEYRAKNRKRDIYEDSMLARLYRDGII